MTEVKTQKISEEKQVSAPSAEAKDLLGTINYLKERGENLSKYSDKLRQNLESIRKVFGNAGYCQICGYSEVCGDHSPVIEGRGQYAGQKFNAGQWHKFKPKVDVSSEIFDSEPFHHTIDFSADGSGEANYFLALLPASTSRRKNYGGLLVIRTYENMPSEHPEVGDWYMDFGSDCSRELLKALVQSGRLPKFLTHAAKKLSEAEQEYKAVAEVAEKMAISLQ